MSLLNLYPAIPLEPLPFAATASVVLAVTVILFVVLVAVGVNVFGANLSMFVTSVSYTFPELYPSDNLA